MLSKFRKFNTPLAFLIGAVFGPYMLSSAKASNPTIEWNHIPFMFFGCVIGMFWVVGLQLIRKDPKYSRGAIIFFYPIAVFIMGSGIGALATGFYHNEFTPASLLFLAIGAGMLVGIFFMRLAFRAKYKSAL